MVKALVRRLAEFVFGHEGISARLESLAPVQALASLFRIRQLINAALKVRPLHRTLPGSGVRYTVENFETLAVERTYFGNPALAELLARESPGTFIDLGCNSGIFPCFLGHIRSGSPPAGLCVDANDELVALAKKNVALNGWSGIEVRCGLVGSPQPDEAEAEFFLAPTSLGSSTFAYRETKSGHPISWKRITVPTLVVEPAWTQLMGSDRRCGCLKIDIEGSEMNFLRQESGLLARVDSILLEWHLWATTRDEVVGFLNEHHFELERVIEEEPRNGLLFFRRSG